VVNIPSKECTPMAGFGALSFAALYSSPGVSSPKLHDMWLGSNAGGNTMRGTDVDTDGNCDVI
jgi:hypothetical protein